MATCYMCDLEATTVEHAPPKCLFPERKDAPLQKDYRKNLVTVPSCEKHNTETSRDDEYLLCMLSASITSNDVGLNQFLTKVKRAAERCPALASSMLTSTDPIKIFHEDTKEWEDAYGIQLQACRLDAVFIKIAYALYFHETGNKFAGRVKVGTGFTLYNDRSLNSGVESALTASEDFFSQHERKGNNPDVFSYKFAEGPNTATMLMNFYGTSKVLVRLDKR